jgi:hypothetical protein
MSSCYIFFPIDRVPKAKFCFINVDSMKIYYSGSQDGFSRVQVESRTPNAKTIKKEDFGNPVREYDLLKLDTFLIKHNEIEIKIWDKSPVIEDYYVYISPSDWSKRKIFFRYSLR